MQILRSILSIALAVLVLVSSTSFTVSMHICRGAVKDVAVFDDAQKCFMGSEEAPLSTDRFVLDWNSCCQDRFFSYEGNDYTLSSLERFALGQDIEIYDFVPAVVISLVFDDILQNIGYPFYEPPLLTRNIPVAVCSFLI